MNRKDLEDRLINFSVLASVIINDIPKSKYSNHISNQFVRCSSSVSLNYGETQGAESKKDFIHKMSLVLKELRESQICLKIIHKSEYYKNEEIVIKAISECNELISIFYKGLKTAKQNR